MLDSYKVYGYKYTPPIPIQLSDLIRYPPYSTHKFHEFKPGQRIHVTHVHALEHPHFCKERYCRYHQQYNHY